MKRVFAILLPLLAALNLAAQEGRPDMEIKQFEEQKVESGREYYGDLPARMTKVVIAGDNSMTDLIFKNAVEESWNISPFEFCDYEEFDRIKTDTNYYFLMRLDKMHRSENDPVMEFVCYLKGNEKAADNISAMPELFRPEYSRRTVTRKSFSAKAIWLISLPCRSLSACSAAGPKKWLRMISTRLCPAALPILWCLLLWPPRRYTARPIATR